MGIPIHKRSTRSGGIRNWYEGKDQSRPANRSYLCFGPDSLRYLPIAVRGTIVAEDANTRAEGGISLRRYGNRDNAAPSSEGAAVSVSRSVSAGRPGRRRLDSAIWLHTRRA